MTPHNSQAGKNAPNKSNDGAPAEHPLKQHDTRKMKTPADLVGKDVVRLESPSPCMVKIAEAD